MRAGQLCVLAPASFETRIGILLAHTRYLRPRETVMNARRALIGSLAIAGAVATFAVAPARAQETVKIGLSAPITGPLAENGRQMVAAVKLYVERYGANRSEEHTSELQS